MLLYKDKNDTVQLYIFVHIFEISVVTKKKTMALHHKHAPICPISRALCRLMDIFAEGLFLDEADAHLKVSQLFERLNCYSVEAKKRYNLDSEKR